MLACLPAPPDAAVTLLPRTQMNTGLQKWETTQKRRCSSYPTPAELDAYAKKVANKPLTIQIFPNSVKVPQRKHVRRTVNGLDTSSSGQRHSPSPSQVSAKGGLLAILPAPAKGVVKEFEGRRARHAYKATMNPQGGSYAAQSTLNVPHLQAPPQPAGQKQGVGPPQSLQQGLQQPPPQALQQRSMAQAQALQRQQSLLRVQPPPPHRAAQPPPSLSHTQALQQQQGPPGPLCPTTVPQQRLSHLHTLKHQTAPPQALLTQQGGPQDLRHLSDRALQHGQALGGSQSLPQAGATIPGSLQHPPAGPYCSRKLPDADAPPNVTVSTSTIPLSMAASLHQNRPGDLSSIVHQINQLCQARAGMGATSVCEGQIANPSPISRNLLINASSRVSSQHPPPGGVPNCLMVGPPDKAPAQTPGPSLHSQSGISAPSSIAGFHSDAEKQLQQQQLQQQLQQQQKLQQQLQQQRSWVQHQMAHMQQPPEGAHPCKNPRMEPPADHPFTPRNLGYPHKVPPVTQGFPLKHPADKPRPPSPANCPGGSMPYMNGHYVQPPWSSLPAPPAGNNGSAPQDHAVTFQGKQAQASSDRMLGVKYRPGKEAPAVPPKLQNFMGGDFQMPGFREQNFDLMDKMHRPAMGRVQDPGSADGVHAHHPGYC